MTTIDSRTSSSLKLKLGMVRRLGSLAACGWFIMDVRCHSVTLKINYEIPGKETIITGNYSAFEKGPNIVLPRGLKHEYLILKLIYFILQNH
jgi:hypothetical protein